MSELSLELDKDERKAMSRGALAFIDASNDIVTIIGPASGIRNAIALNLCPYVEFDGLIRAAFPDPVPHRARIAVNALVRKLWRHPK